MSEHVEVGELDAARCAVESVEELVIEAFAETGVVIDVDARAVGFCVDEGVDVDAEEYVGFV